jgi:hypothetical protein
MAKKTARTENIKVWVTPDMRSDIEELSKKDDRTMSAWIELALRRAIEEAKRKK